MATLARRDLVDILLIEASARIAATALREALKLPAPVAISQTAPAAKRLDRPMPAPCRKRGIETDLNAAYQRARAFLDPALENNADDQWDPNNCTWSALHRAGPSA
jgi:hypothetical protein